MDLSDLSASRINLMSKCARAYRYAHIDRIPEPQEGAKKIFGSVVHVGVQRWYESGRYQTEPLSKYVDACWWEVLPRDVAIALRHCIAAELGTHNLLQLIKISRPDIKQPTATKDYQKSQQFRSFLDAQDELTVASGRCEEIRWTSDENAHQAYVKSMAIADQLQRLWQDKPAPIAVEREVWFDFAGLRIHGFIDQIRQDPDEHGEVRVRGVDIKTGRDVLTQLEAFIQVFLYHYGCMMDETLPTPERWGFLIARRGCKMQELQVDVERHAPLAEKIIHSVRRRVEAEDWAPSFGYWCKSCGFRQLCESEIGFWEFGQDTATLDLETDRVAA